MAQTPALVYSDDGTIDYTPGSDVIAGQVVEIGTVPMIAPQAIASGVKGCLVADRIWRVPQKAEIQTAGDAVYWDPTGDPVTGTAGTGAATGTAASLNLMGLVVVTSEATDTYVYVFLTAAKRTAAIAGSVTADDITGSDSSLGIAGLVGDSGNGGAIAMAGGAGDAGDGGAITVTGGAGDTAGAGGAVTTTGGAGVAGVGGAAGLVGGAGDGANAGGAIAVTGGAGGAAGAGGAVVIAAGAPASGNALGGVGSFTAGQGSGTQAGGAASLVGGAGGSGAGTGAGGAIAVTGGAGGATSGTGGAVVVAGGAGTAGNADGGALTLRGGAKHSAGADGAIAIGDSNTASITCGKMPRVPTTTAAAANSAQNNGTSVVEGFTKVTAADGTKAVVLPSAVAGMVVELANSADNVLKVFPAASDAINAAAANAVYNQTNYAYRRYVAYDATTWYTHPETIA